MANDRIVKTNYDGDHYRGKEGNIWDHLVDNNNNNNGGSSSDGNTGSGESGNNSSGSSSGSNGQDNQVEKEKLISKTTVTKVVTEE